MSEASASAPSGKALARLFEMVHEGVYLGTLSDGASTTHGANPHLKLMFGHSPDTQASEVRPFDPDRFVDPQVRTGLLERFRRDGGVTDFLLRLRRADGSPVWVEVTAHAE